MIQKLIQKDASLGRGFIVAVCLCGGILMFENAFAQDYRIVYDKGMISLSADKTDIKTILWGISKEANIFIKFPKVLQKQITIKLSNVSVKNVLKRFLSGQDYAIIYSASKKNNRDSISKVYVLPEQWGHKQPAGSPSPGRRSNAVRNYNRRLDALRNRLTRVGRGSAAERRILSQIQSIQKTVERLENGPQR